MVKKPSKAQKAKLRKAGGNDAGLSRGGKSGKGRSSRGGGAAAGTGGGRPGRSHLLPPDQQALFESRKRTVRMEESAFSKLSPPVLERLNLLASYAELSRPVSFKVIQFDYSRFGRARAEYHTKRIAEQQDNVEKKVAHPLTGWLNGKSTNDQYDDASSASEKEAEDEIQGPEENGELRLPRRPKWRSDMDPKVVHSQEEEVFRQWLHQTDTVVERAFFTTSPLFAGLTSHTRSDDKSAFQSGDNAGSGGMGGARMVSGIASQASVDELLSHRPAPGTSVIGSLYERNIEVYRQLWRVCERSDLVCVLADARCPLLHLPPSLTGFLERYMRLKVVIVLTKADIVPKSIVEAWKAFLKSRFPSWEVVGTESYAKMERFEGQGSRTRFTPYLSAESRKDLFKALRKAHSDLVTPPPHIREDEEKARRWVPPCATDTDWDGVEKRVEMCIEGTQDEEPPEAEQKTSEADHTTSVQVDTKASSSNKKEGKRQMPPYITIGLIGQPNVGKSSLLNALFGAKVVRASKTPGKTKHFQTHFLVPPTSSSTNRPKGSGEEARRGQIRLCDSPGLVFPSLIGMEMQVMGAVLAISQVQAITSCIRFVAEHIALEQVLSLDIPHDDDMLPGQAGNTRIENGAETHRWTATQILESVAKRYMFKTAKANRWDVNRAGNLVMRAVAEGRIKWAFQPPGYIADSGKGIWISDSVFAPPVAGSESTYQDILAAPNPDDDDEQADDVGHSESNDDHDDLEKEMRKVRFQTNSDTSDDDSGDQEEDEHPVQASASIFSALAVEDADADDNDDDEEEEEEEEEDEDT